MNLTAPPDKFYWSVIDTPAHAQGRARRRKPGDGCSVLPPGLLTDLAADVPVAIEDLHAVALPLEPREGDPAASTRTLICAATLESLAELPPDALMFGPSRIPPELGLAVLKPDSSNACPPINLLIGDFEPRSIRRARIRAHLAAAACLAAFALLVSIGLHRRAAHLSDHSALLTRSTERLLGAAHPGATSEQVALATAQLRDAVALTERAPRAEDAVAALEQVLARWNPPDAAQVKPLSLSIRAHNISASLLLEGDPAAFLSAFTAPPGWTTAEPRITRSGGSTRVDLSLSRDAALSKEPRP